MPAKQLHNLPEAFINTASKIVPQQIALCSRQPETFPHRPHTSSLPSSSDQTTHTVSVEEFPILKSLSRIQVPPVNLTRIPARSVFGTHKS